MMEFNNINNINIITSQSILDRALKDEIYQIVFEMDMKKAQEQLVIDMQEMFDECSPRMK